MRIALYGVLLVAAAALVAVRPGAGDRDRPRATAGPPQLELGGRTDEGLPARALAGAGGIHHLRVRWRMTCERDPSPKPSSIGFNGGFERRAGGFWVGGEQRRTFDGGWSLRYRADVTGSVAANGRSASGRGTLVETWYRHGRVVDRCRSGDVGWRAGLAPRSV
jgi:hypothetical protein